jgi:hypothetical protein
LDEKLTKIIEKVFVQNCFDRFKDSQNRHLSNKKIVDVNNQIVGENVELGWIRPVDDDWQDSRYHQCDCCDGVRN